MRRALVTGAARRLGKAIAEALAAAGYELCLHYRSSSDEAEAVGETCRRLGRRVTLLQADLSDASAATELCARAVEAMGPLDLLVNNASLFEYDDFESMTAESWAGHLDTNLRAPILLCQGFRRQLPIGSKGQVICLLDQRVALAAPPTDYLSYTVSKCGLALVTRMLAPVLAPAIRINAVAPGLTLPSGGQTLEAFERAHAAAPLGRGARTEDVVAAVSYLLSADSVTGQILYVDGGERFRAGPLEDGF